MNFIDYPHIVGTAEERLESIEKYLFRQADNLNYNFTQATPDKIFELAAQAVEGAKSPAAEPGEKANYTALRDLIIKSAGSVVQTGGNFTFSLDGEYVAVSEFGKFKEETNLTIAANSNNIQSLFTKSGEISTDLTNYKSDMYNYISAGYDGDVFALDIGLLKNELSVENKKVEVATPRKIRITPGKLSFYEDTDEVAYMAEKAIYFPEAHITGGTISIANGTFSVDAEGRMTATAATITGAITATSLTLGEGVKVSSDKVSGINDYVKKGQPLGDLPPDGATASDTTGKTGVSISTEGLLKASNAVIYGKIYATDGVFTGAVNASSGKIASWNIGKGLRYSSDSAIYSNNGSDYEVGLKATFGSLEYANYYVARKIDDKWKNVLWINNKGELTSDDGTARTIVGSGQIDFQTTVDGKRKQYGIIKAAIDGNINQTNPMLCIQSDIANSAGVCVSAASDAWYVMYKTATQLDVETDAHHAFNGDVHLNQKLYVAGSTYTAGNLVMCGQKYLYAETISNNNHARARLIGISGGNNVVIGNTSNIGNMNIYAASGKTISLSAGTVKANDTTLATGSDERIKNDISVIDEKYKVFFEHLRPVTYKYKSGRSGRSHIGFIAQEVLQALEQSDLTSQDFAGYVRAESDEPNLDGYELLIRYSEFIALNTFMIQQLIAENKRIKKELLLLKTERTA